MKVLITPLLTTLAVAQLLTVGCTKHHEMSSMSQNKPEDALVRGLKDWRAPSDPNPGLDAPLSKSLRVMPDLARLLQSEASSDERIKAADAMGAIAYHNPNAREVEDTVPVLTAVAQKGDSEVRFRAVQALGAIGQGASNATPVLIELTKDTQSSVRMCAVEALGRIGAASAESLSALTAAMSDTSSDVRITATNALEVVRRDHK